MDDDFNTAIALSVLFDIANELNTAKNAKEPQRAEQLATNLKKLAGFMGILQSDPNAFLQGQILHVSVVESVATSDSSSASVSTDSNEWIKLEIQKRLACKKHKNWALADQIRDELKQQGVILEDKPDGTTSWRRE